MACLESLSGIFSKNYIFRIPDYQRGYAWKNEQLCDFWEDVVNLQDDTEMYHYTGLLSIKPVDIKVDKNNPKDWDWLLDEYKVYHVVDGQQRLTTFIIMVNELVNFYCSQPENSDKTEDKIFIGTTSIAKIREKYLSVTHPNNENNITYLLGYESDDPSEDYLQYKILNRKYSGEIKETYYTRNLSDAKEFFAHEIRAFFKNRGYEGLSEIFKKLTLKLKFNLYEIEDSYNVFVAFETMNNRGKKLTSLELLKNRLIYLTTLFNYDEGCSQESLRKTINNSWKEIYYQLGRNSKVLLPDDEFLRAHWIMFFQYTRNTGSAYVKFLLDWFSQKSIDALNYLHASSKFGVDEVLLPDSVGGESSDDSDTVVESEDASSADKSALDNDKSLHYCDVLKYVNSLKEVAKFWYYTYFPEDDTDSKYINADEKIWLDRLNRIGIGYFRPLVAVSLLDRLNFAREERIELFRAIERFIFVNFRIGWSSSSYGSSNYYRITREVYYGKKKLSEVTKELNVTTDQNSNDAVNVFLTRMNRLFIDNDGFYTWRNLKYFLFEYEYSLSNKHKNAKLEWADLNKVVKDKISIEHIFPQTITDYWRELFKHYSSKQRKFLSSSLGNLLPLAQSINSSLQNDDFDAKKERGYIHGCHSEIEVAKADIWSAQKIYERGMKLLCFMAQRWNFKFSSREQMEELLHVDFIKEEKEVPLDLEKYIRPKENRIFTLCKNYIAQKEELGKCDDYYVRYTTELTHKIIPSTTSEKSIWGTNEFCYYEFECNESEVNARFVISCQNSPEKIFNIFRKINREFKFADRLTHKRDYGFPMETEYVDVSDKTDDELFAIFENLHNQLKDFEKQLAGLLTDNA